MNKRAKELQNRVNKICLDISTAAGMDDVTDAEYTWMISEIARRLMTEVTNWAREDMINEQEG